MFLRCCRFVIGSVLLGQPLSAAEPAPLVDPSVSASAIYSLESDGSGWKRFFQMPQVREIGYPTISPDGQFIAFDGWMPDHGESVYTGRIFVISTKRDQVQVLGLGAMPSWSPDSKKLVVTFANRGIGIMTVATQDVEIISDKGWGATWSPDGKHIALRDGATVVMYDAATKAKRTVFNGAGQFETLYQNGSFSPDSTRFLCLGLTAEKKERAAISIRIDGKEKDADLKRHLEKGPTVWAKMAWHPTEPRIVFAMASPEHGTTQLFEFNPNTSDEPKYIRGQETKFDNKSPFWSPDGKRLYCVGRLHDGQPPIQPNGVKANVE